jgi:hypothetical protein
MHHIIYMSHARAPFTSAQLHQLLLLARRRNTELAITGILLYGNERFMQVLEGEEAAVRALYALIRQDPRHQHVIAYADKPIPARTFPEWAMAFQPNSPQQALGMGGYLGVTTVTVDLASFLPTDAKIFDVLRTFTLP